jgi:hypothetical protein
LDSANEYVPVATFCNTPVMKRVVFAFNAHDDAGAVPPCVFTTLLIRVRSACWAVFVITHVTLSPLTNVTFPPVTACVPQLHADA